MMGVLTKSTLLQYVCWCLVFVIQHGVMSEKGEQVIESFSVQTDIRYRFATTRMVSIVRNTAGAARETGFHVTLPKEAFIVSFAMTIDGKVYDGKVKEKQEAKHEYQAAVDRGESAGHIRQTPRHSNRFDVSVNVENNSTVNFTLTYQEILRRKMGIYEYEMHVAPGQAVKDFSVEVFIQENRDLLFVRTPAMRTKSVITNEIEGRNAVAITDRPTPNTAHIVYRPTLEQQGSSGLEARFVVHYDVEHGDNGDLLVVDGFFLHLFAPKDNSEPLPKDIVFVLDTSGSMRRTKMQQLKEAMKTILGDLNPADRFNILEFSSSVKKWKRRLTAATPNVVKEAHSYVQSMRANGGTNINQALLDAMKELKGRELQSRVGMVFFLTDGEPTVGETIANNIAANVKKVNTGHAIYSLAFGDGADFDALKTISSQNSGFARKIYEASDAALQVETLYREISIVALKDVRVEYLPGIPKATETKFPTVFNGTEIMIAGPCIFNYQTPRLLAKVFGVNATDEIEIDLDIDNIDSVTIVPEGSNPFFSLPRDYAGIVEKMWAFLTIKQLLLEKQRVIENKVKVAELDKKILEMSLKYKFVTPLTSMVVTKPNHDKKEPPKEIESSIMDVDKLRGHSASRMMFSPPRSPTRGQSTPRRRKMGLSSPIRNFSPRRRQPSARRHKAHKAHFMSGFTRLPTTMRLPTVQPTTTTTMQSSTAVPTSTMSTTQAVRKNKTTQSATAVPTTTASVTRAVERSSTITTTIRETTVPPTTTTSTTQSVKKSSTAQSSTTVPAARTSTIQAVRRSTPTQSATPVPTTSTPVTRAVERSTKKPRCRGRRCKKRRGPSSVLTRLTLMSQNGSSMCVGLRSLTRGMYILAKNQQSDMLILDMTCSTHHLGCPKAITLYSSHGNATELPQFPSHPRPGSIRQFVRHYKIDSLGLDMSIGSRLAGKRLKYWLSVKLLPNSTTKTGMAVELLSQPSKFMGRRKHRSPRACRNTKATFSFKLKSRKALRFRFSS